MAKLVTRWSAKPIYMGANPIAASELKNFAGVMKLENMQDLKSCGCITLVGASPTLGTLWDQRLLKKSIKIFSKNGHLIWPMC